MSYMFYLSSKFPFLLWVGVRSCHIYTFCCYRRWTAVSAPSESEVLAYVFSERFQSSQIYSSQWMSRLRLKLERSKPSRHNTR